MAMFMFVVLLIGYVEMKTLDTELEQAPVKRDTACFGTLGCFSTDPPFTSPERPVALAPQNPDHILTKFVLYTREAKTTGQELDARHPETAPSIWTHFKNRPTKVLIHGFLDRPNLTPQWQEMKDEFLKYGDYNVVIVDWSAGNLPPYDQACANARVVGAQISEMIKERIASGNVTAADFHVIGHSLGAHVCGYAGERIPGLGRITGLDPAGPYFENTDKIVRLDSSDALFVDSIHTDATSLLLLGLGTKTPSGHADFYPNMGHDQPGCTRDIIVNLLDLGLIEGVEDTVACSHIRAVHYFTESINTQCPFLGFPCASEDDFKNNLCHSCTSGGCAPLGFHADSHKPPQGQEVKYYLSTAEHKPFCEYHLTVTVKLAAGQGQAEDGTASVVINGDNASNIKVSLTNSNSMTFSPGHTYKFYVMVPSNFGNVRSVSFSWELETSLLDPLHWNILGLRHPKLYVDEIDILREEAGADVHLCTSALSVETGSTLTISTKC